MSKENLFFKYFTTTDDPGTSFHVHINCAKCGHVMSWQRGKQPDKEIIFMFLVAHLESQHPEDWIQMYGQ